MGHDRSESYHYVNPQCRSHTHPHELHRKILYRSLLQDEAFKKNSAARDSCISRAIQSLVESDSARSSVKQALRPAMVLSLLTKASKIAIPREISQDWNTTTNYAQSIWREWSECHSRFAGDSNNSLAVDESGKHILNPDATGLQNPVNLAYWQVVLDLQFAFASNQSSTEQSASQLRNTAKQIRLEKRAMAKKRADSYRASMKRMKDRMRHDRHFEKVERRATHRHRRNVGSAIATAANAASSIALSLTVMTNHFTSQTMPLPQSDMHIPHD